MDRRAKIIEVVQQVIPGFSPEQSIYDSEDSLGFVKVAVGLETAFGIQIPDDFDPEALSCVEQIEEYLDSRGASNSSINSATGL